MCKCIYVCIYTQPPQIWRVSITVCMYICVYENINVCIYVYTNMYTCVYINIAPTHLARVNNCVYVYMYT